MGDPNPNLPELETHTGPCLTNTDNEDLDINAACSRASMPRQTEDHHAIVTRMSALQDIASMDVLCSDKTGTLTTAKMSINLQKIWTAKKDGFGALDNSLYSAPNQELALQQMLMVMGILASNADKKDDAIDGSLLRAWEKMTKEQGEAPAKMKAAFQQLDLTGFNPEVKRTGPMSR